MSSEDHLRGAPPHKRPRVGHSLAMAMAIVLVTALVFAFVVIQDEDRHTKHLTPEGLMQQRPSQCTPQPVLIRKRNSLIGYGRFLPGEKRPMASEIQIS